MVEKGAKSEAAHMIGSEEEKSHLRPKKKVHRPGASGLEKLLVHLLPFPWPGSESKPVERSRSEMQHHNDVVHQQV